MIILANTLTVLSILQQELVTLRKIVVDLGQKVLVFSISSGYKTIAFDDLGVYDRKSMTPSSW